MWLLPHLAAVCTAAVRVYYRASQGGEPVPPTGPVLLVGNHPNSLLDPAFLAWVAQRPIRFLAKEPLFRDKLIGWLIRGSGSLPVYRQVDAPGQTSKNLDTFAAVHQALAAGSAVALFPEGISHDGPELAPLKTGAARIALGAVALTGKAFPIIPVGLVFREKEIFRSEAHAEVGLPVAWDDLAAQSDDRAAVRALTERIDAAMRSVTLNLARWEDEAVIRTAEAVWAAERPVELDASARLARLSTATEMLARLRASGNPAWDALARDVRAHGEVLAALQIEPADVRLDRGLAPAVRWVARRVSVRSIGLAVAAVLATALFWVPYRLTGIIAGRMSPSRDTLSTYRVLVGAAVFAVWIMGLSVCVGWVTSVLVGVLVALALPPLGLLGLYATERWQSSVAVAQRWFRLRRDDPRLAQLPAQQAALVDRLEAALAEAQQQSPA
jgi:1-acyl-sn-glycerol-3-phosphate acyltransferase